MSDNSTNAEIKIEIIEFPEKENSHNDDNAITLPLPESKPIEKIIAETPNAQTALEWCAVLASQKLNFILDKNEHIWIFKIAPELYENAKNNIEQYEKERGFFETHLKELEQIHIKPVKFIPLLPYIIPGLSLFLFYLVTGPSEHNSLFFQLGIQKPLNILKYQQLWRPVTALTLHANLPHILGNMTFFIIFTAVAGEILGFGTALFVVLISGILGNFTTASILYFNSYAVSYDSLGASTAVFGALGLIVAISILRRRNNLSMKKSVPLIAGFALLSLTGTGPGSDVFAHFTGFLWGALLGIPVYFLKKYAKNIIIQISLFVLTAFIVFISWNYALHSLS